MYYLTPKISSRVKTLLEDKNLLLQLGEALGSPLNLVLPQAPPQNLEGFLGVLKEFKIRGKIFYACKANQAQALIRGLSKTPAFLDAASRGELIDALACGFAGPRIEATGPKNPEFLALCLAHGVMINADDLNELRQIRRMTASLNLSRPAPVMARINDFALPGENFVPKDLRFGIRSQELDELFALLKADQSLDFTGFSCHLATTSPRERAMALENLITLTLRAWEEGLNPRAIDLGGGFSLNFLADRQEWEDYISSLKNSLLDKTLPSYSWNDSGLGFWAENGRLRGAAKFSDFYLPRDQFAELRETLSTHSPRLSIRLGDFFAENGVKLYLEPGRSLLDQAGLTLARVINLKPSLRGENLVILEMNRTNLNSQDLEFLSDPVLISERPAEQGDPAEPPYAAFLAGSLCLPHDFITRRKVFFRQKPRLGDWLAFINTAGYFMDFAESAVLKQPLARKAALGIKNHRIRWWLDQNYPLLEDWEEKA